MKQKILIAIGFVIISFCTNAQNERLRVAIFDPTSSGTSIDEGTKLAVQELISSAFVNTGKFSVVERSMIDKIMKEQLFQNSDIADNSQATELGKLAGAHKVVLSAVSLVGGRNMLSIKIIDVQTATVDQQKTKIVGTNDLLDVVEPLTLELLGEQAVYVKKGQEFISQETKKEEVKEKVKETVKTEEQEAEIKELNATNKRQWTFGSITMNLTDGTLIISGRGAIPSENLPWKKYRKQKTNAEIKNTDISEIIIKEGVNSIPDWAFEDLKMTSVTLPNSLYLIGKGAFCGCDNLYEIRIPLQISNLPEKAFYDCKLLSKVIFDGNLLTIGESCFENDENLKIISLLQTPSPPELEEDAFNDANPHMKVAVSNPSVYNSNKKWKKYVIVGSVGQ
jgi:hypothetical protein